MKMPANSGCAGAWAWALLARVDAGCCWAGRCEVDHMRAGIGRRSRNWRRRLRSATGTGAGAGLSRHGRQSQHPRPVAVLEWTDSAQIVFVDARVRRSGTGHAREPACGFVAAGIERSESDGTEHESGGDTRAAAVELVHRMEGSKHFQGAQLVQESTGSESGSGRGRLGGLDLCSGSSTRDEERKVMPDLGNSRRKLKIAIGAMLAADVVAVAVLFSPLVGSADSRKAQMNRTPGGTAEEEPRGEAAARHGQEDRAGQGPDRRILQGPVCRQRFRSARRTGQSRGGKWRAHAAGDITRKRMRRFPAWFPLKSRGVFPEITCNWCDSSMRWSDRRCFLKWIAWAWPAKARGRSSWKSRMHSYLRSGA